MPKDLKSVKDDSSSGNTPVADKTKIPDWLFDNIAETSKNARSIYLLFLSFLVYCGLTVVGTTDRQIILNEEVMLPIANVSVSFDAFFIFAPLTAVLMFVYLQLYLQRLRGLLSDIWSYDAPVAKRRLYPWMVNMAEDPEPGSVGIIQRLMVQLTLWWVLPVVLTLFAFWYIKKHEPVLSYVIGLTPTFGFFVVFYFWHQARSISTKSKLKKMRMAAIWTLVTLFQVFLLILIWFSLQGAGIIADLHGEILIKEERSRQNMYWADLNRAHLEGANLNSTVLKRADLRSAFLQLADLTEAELQEADLENAILDGAYLWGAQLQGANLRNAGFIGADLSNASLDSADLTNADFRSAKITISQLIHVKSLYKAKFDNQLTMQINKEYPKLANASHVTTIGRNPRSDLSLVKRITMKIRESFRVKTEVRAAGVKR